MLRTPPDVLITTPESLYLMLTSRAREFLTDAEWVIVDEIHAVARTKRGAHLALTLERLVEQAGRPLQRIGLSATQRPLEEVGRFLAGPGRKCTIVDAGLRKPLDLKIQVPVESMREPDAHDVTSPAVGGMGTAAGGGDLVGDGLGQPAATARSIWPAIYPELLELVRGAPLDDHLREQPARRGAARRAPERAGRGGERGPGARPDRSRPPRLAGPRGAARGRGPAQVGRAPLPRGHQLPRARDRHGRGRPRDPGRVAEVGDRRAPAHRPRGPRRRRGLARAHLPQVPRRPARVRRGGQAHARRRDRADRGAAQPARRAGPADRGDDGDR